MKRDMLNIDVRKIEDTSDLHINSDEKVTTTFHLLTINLFNWILGYIIAAGIWLVVLYFYRGIHFPDMLLDSTIFLAGATTILIFSSAIGGTKLAVPAALVVYDKAFINDINEARARAFNVLGPFMGYFVALLFFLMYQLESV